jgi:lipoprotein-anchoring transpeptidase ErfK/SrfK
MSFEYYYSKLQVNFVILGVMNYSDTMLQIFLVIALTLLVTAGLQVSGALETNFTQTEEEVQSEAITTQPVNPPTSTTTPATTTPKDATSTADTDDTEPSGTTHGTITPEEATHIKVTGSCDANYQGGCLNVRSGPSTSSPVVTQLRNNIVLKVATTTRTEERLWYQTEFDEWLRYPDRVASSQWWIAGDYVRPVRADEYNTENSEQVETNKRIVVDLSEQMLRAYDGEKLFMKEAVSTGKPLFPTPRGTFPVYKMTPTRYMQGPIDGITNQHFDLPGVPWNLYFTYQGAVIHGAYWHNNFGQVWSNGCVNLPPTQAEKLYRWAELGTQVIVRN